MKQCERLPRRWNRRGQWSIGWHALSCAECRRARRVDHRLTQDIRTLRREVAPADVERHVLQRLGLPAAPASAARKRSAASGALSLRWGATAAVIAVGVALPLFHRYADHARGGLGPSVPPRAHSLAAGGGPEMPMVTAPGQLPLRVPPPTAVRRQPLVAPVHLATNALGSLPPSLPSRPDPSPVARTTASRPPAARIVAPSASAAGDLDYLNGSAARGSHRWEGPAPGEWGPVESQVRQSVPVQDDFITIPFPRLAAASASQVAAAAESYKREAAIVDSRLAREVTVTAKGMALVDLCDRLRADTGIHLAAGRSVADEKVTLFCQKLPLRDVMRQLSRPFGYTWLRSGKQGEYRYELVQDLKSQLMEEELRNRDRNQALISLDREMSQFHPYLGLSPEQARARLQRAEPGEKELLEKLAGPGWGAIQMYFRLSPRDLAALRSGQTLKYSTHPRSGEQPLPADLESGIPEGPPRRRPEGPGPGGPGPREGEGAQQEEALEIRRAGGGVPMPPPGEPHAEVNLSIDPNELGQFTLVGGSGRMTASPEGAHMWMSRDTLALGQSPTAMKPQNAATNASLKSDPALRKQVAVAPSARRQALDASPAQAGRKEVTAPSSTSASRLASSASKVTTADVLEALHRATGLPVVADYYTRLYPPEAVRARDLPLFDTLNRLADTMRLRWNKEDGWLQFRSASYFHDRLKEVPNRLLTHWATSRREHGALTLDDLIEIAGLSDAQLDAAEMAEGARELFGLAEWDLARGRSSRPHLRFMTSFSPAQRQAVTSAAGLAFTRMSLAQQQQFLTLVSGDRPEPAQSLEELAEASLRIDYSPAGSFEWRAPQAQTADFVLPGAPPGASIGPPPGLTDPPAVRERTREAALQAARRIDPAVTGAQIVASQGALTIQYTTTGPNGRVPLLAVRATAGNAHIFGSDVRVRGGNAGGPPPAP